jgi:hypothetical protein
MYVSYTTDQPGSSVGHAEGALAQISLWVLLTWLTYALWACIVKMMLILESFGSSYVHAKYLGLGTSTHVCF